MAVPVHRLQEVSNDLCVRRKLIRPLRGVSREPAGYWDCENRTTGGNVRVPVHVFRPSLSTIARAPAGQVTAGSSTTSADASTSNIQSASAANRWAIWSHTGARNNTFVMLMPNCKKRRMIRAIADRENRFRPVELLKITHRTLQSMCHYALAERMNRTSAWDRRSVFGRALTRR